MPLGDGTGPAGMGPMTGRGTGYCAGYGVPGYANPLPGARFVAGRPFLGWPRLGLGFRGGFRRGYGSGFGRGYGRGYGRGFGRGIGRGRGRWF